MLYTVKELSDLAKVTVKTLHHYHRIGLLLPHTVSDAGYRRALKEGIKYDAPKVEHLITQHIVSLNNLGHMTTAKDFAAQTRFFLQDEFHRDMLESQQTGLAYYLCVAAEDFASK